MEDLRLTRRGRLCLAAFAGELANERVAAARRELEQALEDPGCGALVVDLAGVPFLDSSGIGLLVSLAARAKAAGRQFYLLDLSPQVRKTLELVQLITYFQVLPGREQLAGLEAQDPITKT